MNKGIVAKILRKQEAKQRSNVAALKELDVNTEKYEELLHTIEAGKLEILKTRNRLSA